MWGVKHRSTEVVLVETLDTAKKDLEAKDTVIRGLASRDVESNKFRRFPDIAS